uniref:Uncharacterized protein n=1 Tax=Fundulus heteroclitus TaxID=8078 RepID=A0A3Q2PR52_FUNHE
DQNYFYLLNTRRERERQRERQRERERERERERCLALTELENNKSIAIKAADKGGQRDFKTIGNSKWVLKWCDFTEGEKKILINEHPLRAFLDILPKIHKNPEQSPGRAIVSGIGSLTERISCFLDFHIKYFVPTLKCYVKDTSHFLLPLKDLPLIDSDVIICTSDIESLYKH